MVAIATKILETLSPIVWMLASRCRHYRRGITDKVE